MAKIELVPERPPAAHPSDDRYWDARDLEREMRRVFEICHNCRMCVGYCGTFPDVFARVDRDIEEHGATGAEQLDANAFASATELCWQCKLCYVKCPYTADEGHAWRVDVPRLLMREKAQRVRRNGVTLQDRILGEPQLLGRMTAGPMARTANLVNANRLVRRTMERTAGIAADFLLPPFGETTFARWLDQHKPPPESGTRGTIALFATCLADYNFPSIAVSAVLVLEKNGWGVVRPELTCCGMPNLDGGDMDAAREKVRANVASLVQEIDRGHRIVCLQPTCGYMAKKEWPELQRDADARKVADATIDVMELLEQQRRDKTLALDFTGGLGRVAYHASCHLRAQKIGYPAVRVLNIVPDTEVEVIEHCSAVDGTWGMKAQHYEQGRSYAQKLVRSIDATEPTTVVTDCALAGRRILAETERAPIHPVEALAQGVWGDPWSASARRANERTRTEAKGARMKLVHRGEILGLAEYETVREAFRTRVIGDKRARRVGLGPNVSSVFENRDTVLLQIQEMLRTERITRPAAVQHEIDTYNELVPGGDELSCTLMVEIADKGEREAFLRAAKGLESHVCLVARGRRLAARSNPRWAAESVDRTTAVHYLKFSLPNDIVDALRGATNRGAESCSVALEIDHPAYAASATLSKETILALSEDLQE